MILGIKIDPSCPYSVICTCLFSAVTVDSPLSLEVVACGSLVQVGRCVCVDSPGGVELLLGLGGQGSALLAHQEAGGQGAGAQAGQHHARVAARQQTCEGTCHVSARVGNSVQSKSAGGGKKEEE